MNNSYFTNIFRDSSLRRMIHRLFDIGRYNADLQKRATRGGVLILGSRLMIKVVQFSRTIVVARLLFPYDVGLFALSASVLGIADMLFQPGMASAVIHKESIDKRHIDTAWTVTLLRSMFVGIVAFSAAPFAGIFFGAETITSVIRVLAIAIMINGFENIGAVMLVREVRFNRKIVYDISIVVAETCVVIIGAFVLQSVWALVLGSLANRIGSVVFSYFIHPYRPRFFFDKKAFLELFTFGKWIGIVGIVSYFVAQGDTLTIGRLFGPAEVGFYSLAFGLALLPAVEVSRTLGAVLFPHLSRISQTERGPVFLSMVRGVFLISIPATVGLAVVGEPLVRLIYSDKWLPMLPAFYTLLLYGAIRALSYLIEPLYLSMGRPRVITISTSLHLMVMAIAIVPLGSMFGLPGVASSVLLGAVVSLTYLFVGIRRERHVRLRSIVVAAFIPMLASGAMAVCLVVFESIFPIITKSLLMYQITLGVVIYCTALYILDTLGAGTVRRSLIWLKENL